MNNYILVDVLMEYIIEGNFEKVNDILSSIPDVNKVCYNGFSMLHHASLNGHVKIVEHLVSKGHKINWRDEATGATPIHNAVKSNNSKILKMLMLNGGEINVKDFVGKEPLHYAAEHGSVEIVDLLLSKGHSKIIAMLLRTGADVTAQDSHGRTPLHYSSQQGHLQVVELLLSNKYNNLGRVAITKGVEIDLPDENGSTSFFYSVVGGHFELAKLFASKGANINIQNRDGDTPLMAASRIGRNDVFDFLLNLNAEIYSKNKFGNDAFLISCKNGHNSLILKLLNLRININAVNTEQKNALLLSAENNHTNTAALLVNSGIELNARDLNGDTAILISVRHGNIALFRLLMERGADLSLSNNKGENVFYAATQYGNSEIFDMVIDVYRNFNPNADLSRVALLNAVKHGHLHIAKTLVEKGVDIQTRDSNGDTLLHISSYFGYEPIVKFIIDNGAEINARNQLGETALHKAAAYGRSTKIVVYLLDKGADIEAEDRSGKNPLNVASKRSQFNVFEILLKNDPENISLRKAMLKAASKLPPSLARILNNSRKLIHKYRTAPGLNKVGGTMISEKADISSIIQSIPDPTFFDSLPADILQRIDKLDTLTDYRLSLLFHWIALKVIEKCNDEDLFGFLKGINISVDGIDDNTLINAIYSTADKNYSKSLIFDESHHEYYSSNNNFDFYISILERFDNYIAPYIEHVMLLHHSTEIFTFSNILLKRFAKLKGLRDMKSDDRMEKSKIYEQKANKLIGSPEFTELYGVKNQLYRYKFIKQSMDESNITGVRDEKLYHEMKILQKKYPLIQKGEFLAFISKYEDILDKIDFCRTCVNYCVYLHNKE